jgi:predicted membrane protein DUF2142
MGKGAGPPSDKVPPADPRVATISANMGESTPAIDAVGAAHRPRDRAHWRDELWSRLTGLRPATWFLVLGVPIGLFLAFLVPPFQGLDEPNHFFRVYAISSGTLVEPMMGRRAGSVLPDCVTGYAHGLFKEGTRAVRFRPADFFSVPPGCAARPDRFQPFENTAVNSPVSYLPQVAGVTAARSLGLPLPLVFYAGRLASLLAYLSLVYLALRITPRGQAVLLAVALLPMSLILASQYSADGMTIALALLTTAGVVRCCVAEEATWRSFALTAAAATALALSKNTYWLVALLVVLVPGWLFPSAAVSVAARLGALLAVAVVSVAWYLQVRHITFAPVADPGVIDPGKQVAYILDYKGRYVRLLVQTLVGARTGYFTWTGFVSWLGFARSSAAGTPQPPPVVMVIGYLLLVEAYRRSVLGPFSRSFRAVVRALLPVALVLASAALIVTLQYVTDTAVGARIIWGVQGRYFLPFAAVPLVSLVMLNPGRSEGRTVWPLVPLVLVLATYLLIKVPNYFY